MKYINKNNLIAAIAAAFGIYSLAIVLISISDVYQNWQIFFNYESNLYAFGISAITAITPLSFLCISFFVFKNKRSYFIIPLAIYGYLFFVSFTIYGLFVLLLYWWFTPKRLTNAS
jgi:hypothetical protein